MHQDTFFKYVMSLVDTTGQPVARTIQGIDGKPKHILLGHEVIFENSLPTADAATANQLFVIFGDLSEYDFNSNLTMTYRKYVDEETDEFVDKITLLGDGKVLDPNPFIFFKKATA
jgi:HK97 family phage major capsid protein